MCVSHYLIYVPLNITICIQRTHQVWELGRVWCVGPGNSRACTCQCLPGPPSSLKPLQRATTELPLWRIGLRLCAQLHPALPAPRGWPGVCQGAAQGLIRCVPSLFFTHLCLIFNTSLSVFLWWLLSNQPQDRNNSSCSRLFLFYSLLTKLSTLVCRCVICSCLYFSPFVKSEVKKQIGRQ